MATIYVTTNAASGDGTLAAAVASAQDGDIIQLSGYRGGARCNINLSEALTFSHDVTIAESGGVIDITSAETAAIVNGAAVEMYDVDFIECGADQGTHGYIVSVTNGGAVTLNRSHFLGCYSANHANGGTVGTTGGSVTLNACVMTGNNAKNGAIFSSSASGNELHINDSTIIGNIPRDIYATSQTIVSVARSIFQESLNVPSAVVSNSVHAAPSTIGFASPPPDTIDAATWDSDAALDYDLYLTPSSTAKTGRGDASGYDVDLLPRRVNGAIGAYEFFNADYYINTEGEVSATRAGTYETITPSNISGTVYLLRSFWGGVPGYINLDGATITRLIVPGFFCPYERFIYGGTFGTLVTPATVVKGKYSAIYNECDAIVDVQDYIGNANPNYYTDDTVFTFAGESIKVVGASEYTDWQPLNYALYIGYNGEEGQEIEFLDGFPSGLLVSIVCNNSDKINSLVLHNDVTFTSLALSGGAVVNSGFVCISDDYDPLSDSGLIIEGGGFITAPILAIDPATVVTNLTTTATVCDYGAGLTSFDATPDGDSIAFSWTKTDVNRAVLIQQNQDGVWTTLAAKATGTSFSGGDPEDGVECRAFDGVQFFRSAGPEPAGWIAILGSYYSVRD